MSIFQLFFQSGRAKDLSAPPYVVTSVHKFDIKTLRNAAIETRVFNNIYIAHLRQNNSVIIQQCHNSKFVNFQEKFLKVLKCYNFLWVQRRHNCSPAASFANCFMTLYLLKVHLQTFLSIPITRKCQILSCDTPQIAVASVKTPYHSSAGQLHFCLLWWSTVKVRVCARRLVI